MYEELVKNLRNRRICVQSGGDLEKDFPLMKQAADAIEELQKEVAFEKSLAECWKEMAQDFKARFQRMLDAYPKWISVEERLPKVEKDVLVAFPHNQAVAYMLDDGRWEVISGDGWSTDINIAGGEKIPTHWMPRPKPPKEE